jgi:cation:H+ antiporter
MIINIALFVLGLVLLVKGSDYFVRNVSVIARRMGVSDFIIGLTLVSIGTSLPELVSSIVAASKNQSEIILGNVVGSNIANIGLIGGLIAIFAVTKTKREIKTRDVMIMVFSSIIFYIFMSDGFINIAEGAVFLLLYFAYIIFLLDVRETEKNNKSFNHFVAFFLKLKYIPATKHVLRGKDRNPDKIKKNVMGNFLMIILSGICIYFGAKFLIEQTIFFGDYLEISKTIIGLSVIALGTSLPELFVSISAARKGLGGLVLGNIVGSNISNIFLVIGISSMINRIVIDPLTLYYSAIFMILISLVFWLLMKTDYKLSKKEGVILLVLYIFFIISLILVR